MRPIRNRSESADDPSTEDDSSDRLTEAEVMEGEEKWIEVHEF